MRTEKKRRFVNANKRNVNKVNKRFAPNKHSRVVKQELVANVLQDKQLKRKSQPEKKK